LTHIKIIHEYDENQALVFVTTLVVSVELRNGKAMRLFSWHTTIKVSESVKPGFGEAAPLRLSLILNAIFGLWASGLGRRTPVNGGMYW
jgi:hypothetical protein